jgi:NAD-dependent deacetylase
VIEYTVTVIAILLAMSAAAKTSHALTAKEISEIFKNYGEILVIIGGLIAWFKWLRERHDRAIDVLAELEKKFTEKELSEARSLVEMDAYYRDIAPSLGKCVMEAVAPQQNTVKSQESSPARGLGMLMRRYFCLHGIEKPGEAPQTLQQLEQLQGLDTLLRFYVYLRGVQKARQVPDDALRACYRYWLTFYFNPKRMAFRAYVDWFFPTVSAWLRGDEAQPSMRRSWIRTWPWKAWRRRRFFDPTEFGWIGTEFERRMQLRRGIKGRETPTRVLVVTGAGISAESDLPTFRGKEGYWRKLNPKRLATLEWFEKNPEEVWEWYQERRQKIRCVKPNAAHRAVVALSLNCTDFLLVTQNVDDLHDRAEYEKNQLRKEQIVHIHGQIFISRCTNPSGTCHFERWDREPGKENKKVPQCPKCEWPLRPGVIWFDEDNDPREEQRVDQFLSQGSCDVVLVIGTSATFDYIRRWVLRAVVGGAWLIEINPEKTPLSRFAHHVLHGPAARILPKLVREAIEYGPLSIG